MQDIFPYLVGAFVDEASKFLKVYECNITNSWKQNYVSMKQNVLTTIFKVLSLHSSGYYLLIEFNENSFRSKVDTKKRINQTNRCNKN